MEWNWIKTLSDLGTEKIPHTLVTVCGEKGSTPRAVGAKMIVTAENFYGTIGGGHLERKAIESARAFLSQPEHATTEEFPLASKLGQCCGGSVTLLFEKPLSRPDLFIFGAGHVGQALCHTLHQTPFSVHLVDDRKEWIFCDSLPASIQRHHCEWEDFAEEANWNAESTYVAIMTYRHDRDEQIVSYSIEKPARFLGLIGSQNKWRRFQNRLTARGVSLEKLSRIHCPIGLPIGGKAPQEVAISIASQLLSVYYGCGNYSASSRPI